MRRSFIFTILFTFLCVMASRIYGAPVLDTTIELQSSASIVQNLGVSPTQNLNFKTFNNSINTGFKLKTSENLWADSLFNFSYSREAKTVYPSESDAQFKVYKLNTNYYNSFFNISAGRMFYGQKNTLLPYYGLYDNFIKPNASYLDGVSAVVSPFNGLDLSLIAAKEREEEQGSLYGAQLITRPLPGLEVTPFAYKYKFHHEETYTHKKIYLYGAYLNLDLGDSTYLYVSYARNSGKLSNIYLPNDPEYPEGDAFMVKLDSESETKTSFYKLRFMYLRTSGFTREKRNASVFEGAHPFVYLGSIYTGTFLTNSFPAYSENSNNNGGINNITAYNIGATLMLKSISFLSADFDIYSITLTELPGAELEMGNEMDFTLNIMPSKNIKISLTYAKFFIGEAFKQNLQDSSSVKDPEQYAARVSIKF